MLLASLRPTRSVLISKALVPALLGCVLFSCDATTDGSTSVNRATEMVGSLRRISSSDRNPFLGMEIRGPSALLIPNDPLSCSMLGPKGRVYLRFTKDTAFRGIPSDGRTVTLSSDDARYFVSGTIAEEDVLDHAPPEGLSGGRKSRVPVMTVERVSVRSEPKLTSARVVDMVPNNLRWPEG